MSNGFSKGQWELFSNLLTAYVIRLGESPVLEIKPPVHNSLLCLCHSIKGTRCCYDQAKHVMRNQGGDREGESTVCHAAFSFP